MSSKDACDSGSSTPDTPSPSSDEFAPESPSTKPAESKSTHAFDVAKRFLDDEQVKNAGREQKIHFLKSKGFSYPEIEALLESWDSPSSDADGATSRAPPVITYPEFLVQPSRSPPLVTTNILLNTLYTFSGLTTLLYGMGKFAVEPMTQALSDARISFYQSTSSHLSILIDKLENAVSEVPPPRHSVDRPAAPAQGRSTAHHSESQTDDDSDSDIPTELFHRDMGTQTSTPPSPFASAPDSGTASLASSSPDPNAVTEVEPAIKVQTRKLAHLVASLHTIRDGIQRERDDLDDVLSNMRLFESDLNALSMQILPYDLGYSIYGNGSSAERKDDEVQRAKDNIRRLKGMLLNTRNFPVPSR